MGFRGEITLQAEMTWKNSYIVCFRPPSVERREVTVGGAYVCCMIYFEQMASVADRYLFLIGRASQQLMAHGNPTPHHHVFELRSSTPTIAIYCRWEAVKAPGDIRGCSTKLYHCLADTVHPEQLTNWVVIPGEFSRCRHSQAVKERRLRGMPPPPGLVKAR